MSASGDLSCAELVEIVTDYLEGGLSDPERRRFELHLSYCPGCSNYLGQMRTTLQLVGTLDEGVIDDKMANELLAAFRTWKQST
jgi:anti-sigma factor RsiW